MIQKGSMSSGFIFCIDRYYKDLFNTAETENFNFVCTPPRILFGNMKNNNLSEHTDVR